jgi:hypothetical protein
MLLKVSSLAFVIVLTMTLKNADARKPAVDPVKEISIEEYNDVPPEQAKAYDFSRKSKTLNAAKKPLVRNVVPVKSIDSLEDKSKSLNFLFIFVFATPFLIWFGIRQMVKRNDEDNMDNVTVLKTKKESDDDIDFPKAS